MTTDEPPLTLLLQRSADDSDAGAAVLPRVYEELRQLAAAQMKRESANHTLQATALVHEAWMKLVGTDGEAVAWDGRAHFFSAAAQAMRRILVDRARRVQSDKHGGNRKRQPLDGVDQPLDPENLDFVALDAALTRLATRDPRAAKVVEYRFFAGLSVEDTAKALQTSERTVAREWGVARAWLARELGRGD